MVVVERNWILSGNNNTILISFWDLQGEPCLLKEQNLKHMIPSKTVSELELGEGGSG
jgi:hypothetical protein